MREVISRFCGEYDYPAEARQALLTAYEKIERTAALREFFDRALAAYAQSPQLDYKELMDALTAACEGGDIPAETASMLLYICLSPQLYRYYEERGLPKETCRASLEDLRWKLFECHQVRGIWGSFVSLWFSGFFNLTRFTLGRLQFELRPFPENYAGAGRVPPVGVQQAVNLHIPSSGPLLPEDCAASYRRAQAFFAGAFPGGETPFVCYSWLLFPEHRQFLPAHSRILQFMDTFDIFDSQPDPQGHDLWRIFGREDCSDTASLPEETSLQRAYKQWLLSGHTPGSGSGLFVLKA